MSAIAQPVPTPGEANSAIARAAVFAYGTVSYLAFFFVFLYAIAFVAPGGSTIVPKAIDDGPILPILPALGINAVLLVLFVVQHTIMARPAFKQWITRYIPKPVERSTFVIAASACLALLFWLWKPQPQIVWDVSHIPVLNIGLTAICLAGFGIVLYSSFLINHFDLFGLRQVWLAAKNKDYSYIPFRIRGIYKMVRHPLMLGFLIAFWTTPTMTVGHLFFAAMTTGYIFFGVYMEERDLISHFGERYLQYKKQVRGIIPLPKKAPEGAIDLTDTKGGAL